METDKIILNPGIIDSKAKNFAVMNTFSSHSNEVEEIISNKPPFIVRWGILFFFLLLLLLAFIGWFIKYPDIIKARGLLNSINAPKEIQTKTNGKLIKLFEKENQQVHQNEIIGYIESTANHTEVISLSKILDTITEKINNNSADKVVSYLAIQFNNLGELQTSYQIFSNSFSSFTNYLSKGFYLKKKGMLSEDISYLKRLHNELMQQKNLSVKDLSLSDSTFQIYQTLKNQKVISTVDYRLEKSKFIAKQMTLPQINSSIINNESQQHEKQKEIAELENQIQQQKNLFVQSLNTIKSQVEDWEKKYLIRAPIDGRVSFVGFLQENQELKTGQLICYINPGNTDYYVETLISQYNFGKIKTEQEVLLKFQAYPYQEFGFIKGNIEIINAIPADSGYLAKVSLPENLITNYKKIIQYKTGLLVQADIVTENLNLLQRLFYNLRKMIH